MNLAFLAQKTFFELVLLGAFLKNTNCNLKSHNSNLDSRDSDKCVTVTVLVLVASRASTSISINNRDLKLVLHDTLQVLFAKQPHHNII
jgi:hypothetical protein